MRKLTSYLLVFLKFFIEMHTGQKKKILEALGIKYGVLDGEL